MTAADQSNKSESLLSATVVVTALGYMIDMFDLFAFNMVRVKSLTDLGLQGKALTDAGLNVSNCQWAGLLIGAYCSGVLSDRIGRKKSLLAAIIVYSIGSILSGCAVNEATYGIARFITGLGLAGELGSGVTLIAESYKGRKRGIGVMIFIVLGFIGVLLAAAIANQCPWRQVYLAGGIAGALLVFTRTLLPESKLYLNLSSEKVKRGGLGLLLQRPALARKYLSAISLQLPLIFIPQIIWTLSPELAVAKGLTAPVQAQLVLLIGFSCVIISDLLATSLSELLKSRSKATLCFLIVGLPAFLGYLAYPAHTAFEFYVCNGLLGLTFGIWVIAATWVAENFGTDIRGTVATTVPNFTRASTILLNIIFGTFKEHDPLLVVGIMGCCIYGLSLLGWFGLEETWGRELEFTESQRE